MKTLWTLNSEICSSKATNITFLQPCDICVIKAWLISLKWEHNGTSLQTCDVCVTVKGMIDIITGAHATTLQPTMDHLLEMFKMCLEKLSHMWGCFHGMREICLGLQNNLQPSLTSLWQNQNSVRVNSRGTLLFQVALES